MLLGLGWASDQPRRQRLPLPSKSACPGLIVRVAPHELRVVGDRLRPKSQLGRCARFRGEDVVSSRISRVGFSQEVERSGQLVAIQLEPSRVEEARCAFVVVAATLLRQRVDRLRDPRFIAAADRKVNEAQATRDAIFDAVDGRLQHLKGAVQVVERNELRLELEPYAPR